MQPIQRKTGASTLISVKMKFKAKSIITKQENNLIIKNVQFTRKILQFKNVNYT